MAETFRMYSELGRVFYYDGTITLSIRLLALHSTVTTALAKSVSVPVSWVMQRHSGIMRKDKVYDDKQNDRNWFFGVF